jgi:tetratricopeptide (TPR) repeat protein
LGQYNTAENYYKEALQIETSNLTVYYQLINLELTRKNLPEVKKYINKGFSIDSDDSILLALYGEYYYRLGLGYYNQNKLRPAKEKFQKAISVWQNTKSKTSDPKWIQYAREGIERANKLIVDINSRIW